jgi:elongation factor 1-gamma
LLPLCILAFYLLESNHNYISQHINMKLLSFEGDPRALKAKIVANINGVDLPVEYIKLGEDNTTPEFLAMSPLGKVPVLQVGKSAVFESNAIARYVARLRGDTELLGSSFVEQAQVDAWIDFVAHNLEVPLSMWTYPVLGWTKFNKAVHHQVVTDSIKGLEVLNKHLTANTWMVGSKMTLADIVAAMALLYPMKVVLDAKHVGSFPAVLRWFTTVVNQPAVAEVVGPVTLCTEEMLAEGNTGASKKGGKKGGKKAEAKKAEPKEEVAVVAAPAPAPAPAPAKKAGPFDHLPKSSMSMDGFKTLFSNAPNDAKGDRDYYAVMDEFWSKMYDAEGYSVWFAEYNYNVENTQGFMTSNLVGGFVQRTDAIRKFAFGTMQVLNEEKPFEVFGCWMFRGDSVQPMMDANPDAEYYTWTKADTSDPAVRARINDYWCAYEKVDGKTIYDTKTFK